MYILYIHILYRISDFSIKFPNRQAACGPPALAAQLPRLAAPPQPWLSQPSAQACPGAGTSEGRSRLGWMLYVWKEQRCGQVKDPPRVLNG